MRLFFAIALLIFLSSFQTIGQIIHIPEDYPTIQEGINAAEEGDTVLVSPGTYYENLSLNGINITLASYFLTTADTSYITSTIINGNDSGTVLIIDQYEDAITRLSGLSITNGGGEGAGGGIRVLNADPSLDHLNIYGNRASNGGGLHLERSNSTIDHCRITNNSSEQISNGSVSGGGGIYIGNTTGFNIVIKNSVINDNSTIGSGGGIYDHSAPLFLMNVDIVGNTAYSGGGISGSGAVVTMDSINRCNIHSNRAVNGNDLYNPYLNTFYLFADTFSVINPTDFHAKNLSHFEFDILNAKLTQVDADLYISSSGNDSNSGLSPSDPLKTIQVAFSKMLPFSGDTNTVYVDAGIYSPSATHEFFPVTLPDYLYLEGDDTATTILNAEGMGSVIWIDDNMFNSVSDMTITGGHADQGAGIYCYKTDATITDLYILDCQAEVGGGIYAYWCHPGISDCHIQGNTATVQGGGIYLGTDSWAWDSPHLTNLLISNNHAGFGGGISMDSYVTPVLEGLTICYNTAGTGGGIHNGYTDITFNGANRCNIYLNSASSGNDLYSPTPLDVYVDTFTVMNPTEFHASKLEKFSFDILNSKLEQVEDDLYISPEGDDANSGLTEEDPLKTIHHALTILLATESDQRQIHLLDGTYSAQTNGEFFPVALPDYMHISGTADSLVILDADSSARVMQIIGNDTNHISDLTLRGGLASNGAGIYLENTDPHLERLIVCNNSSTNGAGMYCNNSDALMNDLIITENHASSGGGGMLLVQSNPQVHDVDLGYNTAGSGGGISVSQTDSRLVLEQVSIHHNQAGSGAGLYNDAFVELQDCEIVGNTGNNSGGGIFSYDSLWIFNTNLTGNVSGSGGGIYVNADAFAEIDSVDLSGNTASGKGGGLYCGAESVIRLDHVNIQNNISHYRAGGIYCATSNFYLKKTLIAYNHADEYGGGMYCDSYVPPNFDSVERCNLYLNYAGYAKDIMAIYGPVNVVLDTFTVMFPTDYHVNDLNNFTFDILNGKVEQADADLYVSPAGNDENTGLTTEEPLKTIDRAFLKLRSDINHQHTIHLANGIYSRSTNGERFPVQLSKYSSLVGESRYLTILDAEDSSQVICLSHDTIPVIRNMTLTRGKHHYGAGIGSSSSEFKLYNLNITNNQSNYFGGGVDLGSGSRAILENLALANNSSDKGGGVYAHNSELEVKNVDFNSNHAITGAGIHLEDSDTVMMENVRFTGNISTEYGGGIYSLMTDLILTNVEMDGNGAFRGGGIWAESTSIEARNSLFTHNNATEGFGSAINIYNYNYPYKDFKLKFINSTFTENSYPGFYLHSGEAMLTNNIIWGNEGPFQVYYLVAVTRDDTLSVMNSDIQGGAAGICKVGPGVLQWLPGNIDGDPQFSMSVDDPYSLDSGSPCIDTGTPDTTGLFLPYNDFVGNARIWDGDEDGVPVIDMGPYEYGAPVTVPENIAHNKKPAADIKIWPNPASDRINLFCPDNDDGMEIIFMNNIGQNVHTEIIPSGQVYKEIKLDQLGKGIYTLQFRNYKGMIAIEKLLLVR